MKILLAFALIGLVAGKAVESPVEIDYHDKVGIPAAARIKAAEAAMDFDRSRIVGGSPAALGQFPYLGGLIIHLENGAISVCGSSLLSNTRGITAAHCCRTFAHRVIQFTVVYGSTLLFSGGTRVTTSDFEMHPGFDRFTYENDVAIIRIPHVAFNNNIRSIPIATSNDQFVGTWAEAAGYGFTSDGGALTFGTFVSHVALQVISNAVCLETYHPVSVHSSTLCVATTGGRSTCVGDSGGPLVANNQLIGVTSFGYINSCLAGNPVGFARVSSFASWIQAHL